MKLSINEVIKVSLIVAAMTITSHFLDCYFTAERSCTFSVSDGRTTHQYTGSINKGD